jgi:beta-lactamase regulating signal transducer with metallopeptidase domain
MDVLLNWMWQGSVVALALVLTLRLLTRVRANVRYGVAWAALLLVMALPAIPRLLPDTTHAEALAAAPAPAIVSVPDAWWTSSAVLLAVWAVWAVVHTARLARDLVALRRARAASRPFPAHVESCLTHWSRVRGRGRRPSLVLSESMTAAAVLGGGAPTIAVAPSLLTALDPGELDRVLIHEWAHVQRRDDIVHLLQILIRIVAGWHPAVRWIERRLHLEREVACDELTVALTGSPASYAACLVKLATARGPERMPLAAPAMLRASGLRARVTRIVSQRAFMAPVPSRSIAAAGVAALGVLALGVSGVRLVEPALLALPLHALPIVSDTFPDPTPAAQPARPRRAQPATRPAATAVAAVGSQRVTDPAAPAPGIPAAAAVDEPAAPNPLSPAPTTPQPADASHDAPAPVTAPVAVEAVHTPPASAGESDRSPWGEIADHGTAFGRKSKDAGVATAGAFTRFARRVAGAF